MKLVQYLSFSLLSLLFITNSYASESDSPTKAAQVGLSILSNPIKPGSVITVQWQGPDKPRDQIILSTVNDNMAREPIAFVYTIRGNPVKFQAPDSGLFELTYNMHTIGTISMLTIDCSKELVATDGACKIVDLDEINKNK